MIRYRSKNNSVLPEQSARRMFVVQPPPPLVTVVLALRGRDDFDWVGWVRTSRGLVNSSITITGKEATVGRILVASEKLRKWGGKTLDVIVNVWYPECECEELVEGESDLRRGTSKD